MHIALCRGETCSRTPIIEGMWGIIVVIIFNASNNIQINDYTHIWHFLKHSVPREFYTMSCYYTYVVKKNLVNNTEKYYTLLLFLLNLLLATIMCNIK